MQNVKRQFRSISLWHSLRIAHSMIWEVYLHGLIERCTGCTRNFLNEYTITKQLNVVDSDNNNLYFYFLAILVANAAVKVTPPSMLTSIVASPARAAASAGRAAVTLDPSSFADKI